MTVLERLKTRKPKAIKIDDDELWVRSFTMEEALHVEQLAQAGKERELLYYSIARCVTDSDGDRLFKGDDDPEISQVPVDRLRQLMATINKLSFPEKPERTEKN